MTRSEHIKQYLDDNNLPYFTWMGGLVSVDLDKFTKEELTNYNNFVYNLQKK